jgi:hypothetical protein
MKNFTGAGSWGNVGLWAKRSLDGNASILDVDNYCAIKEVAYAQRDQYEGLAYGVVEEAIFQFLAYELDEYGKYSSSSPVHGISDWG